MYFQTPPTAAKINSTLAPIRFPHFDTCTERACPDLVEWVEVISAEVLGNRSRITEIVSGYGDLVVGKLVKNSYVVKANNAKLDRRRNYEVPKGPGNGHSYI